MDDNSQKNQEIIQKRDDKLKSIIKRLERLSEEKNNINFDIKEVFSEAKSSGAPISFEIASAISSDLSMYMEHIFSKSFNLSSMEVWLKEIKASCAALTAASTSFAEPIAILPIVSSVVGFMTSRRF